MKMTGPASSCGEGTGKRKTLKINAMKASLNTSMGMNMAINSKHEKL